jgi:hypothetical protein
MLTGLPINKVREIIVTPLLTDEEVAKLNGDMIDKCDTILTESCDVYIGNPDGSRTPLAKFRKKWFPDEIITLGFEHFHKLSATSRSRGAAAGPIDISGAYFKDRTLTKTTKLSTIVVSKAGKVSTFTVNNQVNSSVIGYLDKHSIKYSIPCRLTALTKKHLPEVSAGMPFITAIDQAYQLLMPEPYALQKARADLRPAYRLGNTAFSSVTINRNFRTGLHCDGGDFKNGFGNLTVIERGQYSGGATCFPQYGIGFDVRTGDFLAMNVHKHHCNLPIYETPEQELYNKSLPELFKKYKRGTEGQNKDYCRLTFVCYLRDKIATKCPENPV